MKDQYRGLILILGFSGFVSAADNWFVSPSLPAMAASFGVSTAAMGAVLTAYMIPYGAMQPVYGFFSDRFSKRRLLQIIVLGLSLGTAAGAFTVSLTALCWWRGFIGFFAAGIIAVSLAYIGDMVAADQRQVYVGRFMGIVFAGQGISAGLGGILTRYISWRGAFLFFAALGIFAALALFRLPKEKRASHESRKTDYQSRRTDNMEQMVQGGFFYRLKEVCLKSHLGRMLFPFAFASGFLLLGSYGFLGSYLHERTGLDFLQGGLVVMFYGFACLLGGSRVGAMSLRFGRRRVILCGVVFALIGVGLLLADSRWPIALIATVCLGFGYICVQSTLATAAFDVSLQNTGLSSGLVGLGLFCGGGVGSAVGGIWLNHLNYGGMYLFFAVGLIILGGVAAYCPRFLQVDMLE